jgi:hypothetical protein
MRKFPESNYWAIFNDGVTVRFVYDPKKPITNLQYPEFYDIKITNTCSGKCPWCYMNSQENEPHYPEIVQKFKDFFGPMTMNQKPFQIAFGGGNPNEHPEFCKLMEVCSEMGIMPNYTTNGIGLTDSVIRATYSYCGGVAISTHSHLEDTWKMAVQRIKCGIVSPYPKCLELPPFVHLTRPENMEPLRVNLHIIVSDKASIQRMAAIYEEFKTRINYFVLLPQVAQGRATTGFEEEEFLFSTLRTIGDLKQFAFGAKLYPALCRQKQQGTPLDVMLYEPEIMSKFIDFKDMKMYPSSFDMGVTYVK